VYWSDIIDGNISSVPAATVCDRSVSLLRNALEPTTASPQISVKYHIYTYFLSRKTTYTFRYSYVIHTFIN